MKKNLGLLVIAAAVFVTSCTYQKNNRIDQKDLDAGSEYVYGNGPDSMARQRKVQYTANPENDAKVNKIRSILYGNNGIDGSNSVAVN